MEILYLAIVFALLILLLALKRPLWQAMLGGILATILLYRLPLSEVGAILWKSVSGASSLSMLLSIYLVGLLQKILDARGQIRKAQSDLDGIFHNRRINAAGAALFVGLLPSAAAMLLACEVTREATEGYLKPEEQAFTASWLRHVPESALPTYTSVLLLLNLTGVPTAKFLLRMLFPLAVLIGIGCLRYLRRIPKAPQAAEEAEGDAPAPSRLQCAGRLFCHLWTLLLAVVLILAFDLSVTLALGITIVLAMLVYRVAPREWGPMLKGAFHANMLLSTLLVLVLKEAIASAGVLPLLPAAMQRLPLPGWLLFALLLFAATVISGATGGISLVVPLAVSALGGGLPLCIYLACICHAGSQVSPTHVCLAVAAENYGVSLGRLIRQTIPMVLLFCLLMTGYYLLLCLF